MKILAIRGKNLASLAAEFEVDFQKEPLTSAGLFAICGPTGSGKSTLLDALSLALYDDTPRLNKAGTKGALPDVREDTITPKDSRNLLRRGVAEGFAEVDFAGNDNVELRARWSVRRARGRIDGKLKGVEMTLVRLNDQQRLGGTNTEVLYEIRSRLGLSFEQFTRSVLLAQNEFFVFLKADDNDRATLLETLTGTDTYTGISKRAFERAKIEGDVLARLRQKLEDQKPLEAEERLKFEQENNEAVTVSERMEKDKTAREKHLAWYAALDQLKNEEQRANQEADVALNEKKSAEPRRIEFMRIEHVQNAKPHVVELDRLIDELQNNQNSVKVAQQQLDAANKAYQDASSNLAAAKEAVANAEQARNNAADDLGKARSLDARITTLQPLFDQAEKDLQAAQEAEAGARTDLVAKQEGLNAATQKLKDVAEWLAKNEHLKSLAESWPRWDTLFGQARETLKDLNKAIKELTAAKDDENHKTTAAIKATGALEKETSALQAAEAPLKAADQALVKYDVEDMVAARKKAEDRRDQLAVAESVWQRLATKQSHKDETERKAEEQQRAIKDAEAELDAALKQKPACEAALKQAESSLKRAQLACADNVEKMRSAIEDGAPCPVCGSKDHPYATTDPQYHGILDSLQAEVEWCRKSMAEVEEKETSNKTLVKNGLNLLSAYEKDIRGFAAEIQTDSAAWLACPVAVELNGIEKENYREWIEEQKRIVLKQRAAIDETAVAYRVAVKAKNEAQTTLDRARLQYQTAQKTENAAKSAIDQAIAAASAAVEKKDNVDDRLDAALAALSTVIMEHDWRKAWAADPERYHQQQKNQADLWSKNSGAAEQLKTDIAKLQIEITGLNNAFSKTAEALSKQKGIHQKAEGDLAALRGLRQVVFEGKSADAVEAAFAQAIDVAKRQQEAQNESLQKSLAEQARTLEAHTQAGKNLHEQEGQMREAEKVLVAWIAEYNSSRRDKDVLSIDRLRKLVVYDGVWIAKVRAELQKLDDAIERTKAVLKERKERLETHKQARPTNDTIEVIQAALVSFVAKLSETKERATELAVKLRQDDECIAKSAEVRAEIQAQETKERVWAQLSDLIGSADGKKFRNYAQQFTLDVLIGYANRHLVDLSRRYRLERVKDTLALLIVDQDMGDERRSVHSLSGGESFLVSLALALGLASLSSNRVRVESLFIDEGFGSLDAETLLIAMDALDNLQSQGRKVGVISHVQEMTERIGAQIQVKRMSGGQSRIEVVSV